MSDPLAMDPVRRLLRRFGDAQWKVSAQKLLGANLLAQIINLVFIPVLTRIYPPTDYAVLATLMAISVILSLVAALGFDYAVPIVDDDDQATCLTQAGACSAIGVAAAVSLAALTIPAEHLVPVLGDRLAATVPWAIGLIVLSASLSTTLEALQIRHRRVDVIGWARVAQACVGVTTQIGLGLVGAGAAGLVIGYGLFLLTPAVVHIAYLAATRQLRLHGPKRVWEAASSNRKYLHYTAPEALFNALSVHGPFMIISYFGSTPVIAAHLSLGLRLLQAPSFLVAKIGSQLVQGSARNWHTGGSLADNSRKIALGLGAIGVVAGVPAIILAPLLATPVFGPEWTGVGWVIAMLVPGVVLHMVSFPLIPVAYLKGQNAGIMILTASTAVFRNGLCAIALASGGFATAVAFSGGAIVQYAILTAYLYRLSRAVRHTEYKNVE
ncbi:lipopolysaccharide biosynthesis protein [Sphingopyxis terrae]|uniref:lipopolysaccharide biosynthesis protein n=1 Tax=Sphingopyxis terrae TaxID=33052 RepID=UPI003F7E611B